jgi:putative transposase
LDSLEKQFHTFLLEVYHRRPSSEGKLSPKERWEQGGFLPRMPDSVERLDLSLIHEVRTRKVRTDGIHFHNFRYLSLTLAAYVGEEVTIRFDPRGMGEIRVFYRDRFLRRAISADLAGQTVPLREIVNARKRRQDNWRRSLELRCPLRWTHDREVSLKKLDPRVEPDMCGHGEQ